MANMLLGIGHPCENGERIPTSAVVEDGGVKVRVERPDKAKQEGATSDDGQNVRGPPVCEAGNGRHRLERWQEGRPIHEPSMSKMLSAIAMSSMKPRCSEDAEALATIESCVRDGCDDLGRYWHQLNKPQFGHLPGDAVGVRKAALWG